MKRTSGNKLSALLTTMIVLTAAAIAVVGFVLAWDIFDINGKLNELMETSLYAEAPLLRSDTKVDITVSKSGGVPAAEIETMKNFFTCYYASLGSFYHEDISRFFAQQCNDRLFDDLTLDTEISAARTSTADLSFKECSLRISMMNRRSINREKANTVRVAVQVSSEIKYGSGETPSRTFSEQHVFLLTTKGKNCLISGHTTDRQARVCTMAALDEALAEEGFTVADMSYTYFPPYISRAAEILTARLKDIHDEEYSEEESAFTAEYDYDREAAVTYAQENSHSAKYGEYEENDANFCSQCLAESGVPMDDQGDKLTQWKWYGYEENNEREKSGCTKSWFDRGRFWTYATENSGFGLVAQETRSALPGDIVQMMNGETPVLQAIISDTVVDIDGRVADYLICTDTMKNVPLSLVWAGERRFAHIIGYNTANI